MRSFLSLSLSTALLFSHSIAPAEDQDLGGSGMWEHHRSNSMDSLPAGAPSSKIARTSVVGHASDPPREVLKSSEKHDDGKYVVTFGAGASMVVPYRISDGTKGNRLMSEFSVSWAPFGMVGEVGADMVISKNSSFVFRPNLKFFFVKHELFSAYLEGSCAIYSDPYDTYVGGGGEIGLLFGVMKHLAIEFRAGGSALYMSDRSSNTLLDGTTVDGFYEESASLVLLLSIGTRLIARF